MISEKVKRAIDNMPMAELKMWIHSTYGAISEVAMQKENELKDYIIKKYYEKYGNL